tara:strand:+ start:147973 stop:148260 length:288 start_codon:yes stop_codon:yes gene_type:complete
MGIDKATVLRISRLARIQLDEQGIDSIAKDLDSIINWVEQLNEVNTKGITPMTSVVDVTLPKREDLVTDAASREDLLSNAPDSEEGFFVVPKVIE